MSKRMKAMVSSLWEQVSKYTMRLPLPELDDPVFIIGCGRSGTTILGHSLSHHHDICYFNEPRGLWSKAFPETDVWSKNSRLVQGKMCLTGQDADAERSRRLRRLFWLNRSVRRRRLLVEKLPINNFRLDFLNRIFPEARFISIARNGVEVARSIEKAARQGAWFGENDYKWDQLVEYSSRQPGCEALPALCDTDFEKGLLEWRLSTQAARRFLSGLPEGKCLEVSYRSFMDEPVRVMKGIMDFLNLEEDPKVNNFVRKNIARRSQKASPDVLSEKARIIGGDLLQEYRDK